MMSTRISGIKFQLVMVALGFSISSHFAHAEFKTKSGKPDNRTLYLECEFYKGSVGRYIIDWDESDYSKPAQITESKSLSVGDGRVTSSQFSWDKDLSTFYVDRKTNRLKIVPKDGYKPLDAPCQEIPKTN